MKLLALDTTTQACSVALNLEGQLVEDFQVIPREHARRILPMVEQLLAEQGVELSDLDGIAYGNGPGSFTGLRIAASIAQGLAFGADLPVLPVSSMAAMALGAARLQGTSHHLVVQDAHMQEFYWAAYQVADQQVSLLGEERLTAAAKVEAPPGWQNEAWVGIGDGWNKAGEFSLLSDSLAQVKQLPECYPHAYDVALLGAQALAQGQQLPAEQAIPVYLRGKSAWKTKYER